ASMFWLVLVIASDVCIHRPRPSAVRAKLKFQREELECAPREPGANQAAAADARRPAAGRLLWVLGACMLALGTHFARGAGQAPAAALPSDPTSDMLEAIRNKHQFPVLAAAVIVDGKVVATNVVGFRKRGGSERAQVTDKFHIGSVTKSMTATVAAMLVEQGRISWQTRIGESFADLGTKLHADYRDVTLEQLLAHRGGAPAEPPDDLWKAAWRATGSGQSQRLDFVRGLLARAPETKPGTKAVYSNQGYAIAGVMLEKAVGKPWEELMRTMLFDPLQMKSAGFGAPASPGEVDQPWGHTWKAGAGFRPVPPGPGADNPAAIGPAGTVHCSLPDLAYYVVFHLAGARETGEMLKPGSFKKLHESAGDGYALGWVVLERKWAGGKALMHTGSNTMFYVVVWMAPRRNAAVIVATNVGSDPAFAGCDEAASRLIQRFLPQ
ncbi:MAG: beta-lactamase family protein, partial [Verrucomicrobia bacterium]|nr:beta-lactamase family protein [Verrucomicrobiota bacterium]